jgi:integrase
VRRTKKGELDLGRSYDLTAGLIDLLVCPPGKTQAFLRDRKAPGLRVRVTAGGAKSFVFEGKLSRSTIRRTIGSAGTNGAWSIEDARIEANRLRVLLDQGTDPRELDKQQLAAAQAKKVAEAAAEVTVGDAWATYLTDRQPYWSELHYRDHVLKASLGGEPTSRGSRGTGTTQPGPLAALMPMKLKDLTAETVAQWAAWEAKSRPTSARLALRLLRTFLRWCTEHGSYAALVPERNPAKSSRAREALGKATAKSDVLHREQLAPWFKHVLGLPNPVIAAALQLMLLTGARPGEVLRMRWEDVNTNWKSLTIRDKVEGERVIPATPYVLHLLAGLPRRNDWVFSSPNSESGQLTEPNHPHTRVCAAAGLPAVTLHGLRRSFSSLTEWLEVPAGIVAQIMGHKPSATAEKYYKVRPLDLLALHHGRIEAWMLEQAGVEFDAKAETGRLALVKA